MRKENTVIDSAVQFMKENYNKNLDMAVISNHVSLNYTYFSFLFREQTGLNFVVYLKKLRIEKAQELLKDTRLKINEISKLVGYQNIKLFRRNFRTLVGVCPLEYRNKHKIKVQEESL